MGGQGAHGSIYLGLTMEYEKKKKSASICGGVPIWVYDWRPLRRLPFQLGLCGSGAPASVTMSPQKKKKKTRP